MRNKLLLICVLMSTTAFAQVSPGSADGGATQQRQPLLSRLRGGETANTRQQLQREPVQVAQPANTGGYQPGVTYPTQQQRPPQQQQQPQYQQPQPGYQQPGYSAYPPQQMQAPQTSRQQPAARATPTPTPTPRSGRSTSNSSRETPRSTRSSSRNSDSDEDSQDSSEKRSSGSSSSSNSSRSDSKSSNASNDDKKEASTKPSSSSALEKIVKNVESGKSEEKKKSTEQSEEAAEVKKTKEEIAAEKTRAAGLKSADEATTVVANFLKQANDSNYSKATDSLAPAIQKYFESEISAVNGTKKTILDEITAKGTMTMVTYINTTVRGEGAVVETELGYEGGQTVLRSFDMIKIDGDWKILLAVKEDNSPAQITASGTPTPIAQTNISAPASSTPDAATPPTAEQAASRGPLMLVPPTTNPGSLSTTESTQ